MILRPLVALLLAAAGRLRAAAPFETAAQHFPLPRYTALPEPGQVISLDGAWEFDPATAADWSGSAFPHPRGIAVPGEWTLQGFAVAPGGAAAYRRRFTVPAAWRGQRVKARFEAVYSEATVYVNGRQAGRHVGGFTPFELDVTDLVRSGPDNVLALRVASEGDADRASQASAYAGHPLGGILRSVRLFAVPALHLAGLRTRTSFTADFKSATLHLEYELVQEGPASAPPHPRIELQLTDPAGAVVETPRPVRAGPVDLSVACPRLWDNEHPNLYTLVIRLSADGSPGEVIRQRIGFREVEVRGNRLCVNGRPVKLAGACHHEVDPLHGRAVTAAMEWQDVRLFRAANITYLRTSHYPPSEDLIAACDELGMFVEEEAPFCWVPHGELPSEQRAGLYTRQTLEMVARDFNHPSIILWSLGNESKEWANYFLPTARRLRDLRTGRALNFSQLKPGGDDGFCDVGNHHYPGPAGPAEYASAPRPIVFDEYCHLNAYNRHELAVDPGVRDSWGEPFGRMWAAMRQSPGTLGGAIWAGIDDMFLLPSGKWVGYGPWGLLDGWRRPKPEYFYVRKYYSPVRVTAPAIPAGVREVRLAVENRQTFSDLGELRFDWQLGAEKGQAAARGAPGSSGPLVVALSRATQAGQTLRVDVRSSRGFSVDNYAFPVAAAAPAPAIHPAAGPLAVRDSGPDIVVSGNDFQVTFARASGRLLSAEAGGQPLLQGGPALLLLPLDSQPGLASKLDTDPDHPPATAACLGWTCRSVRVEPGADHVRVVVDGAYREATGSYTCTISADGRLRFDYRFTVTQALNPRQIGLVFAAPAENDTLAWHRRTELTGYPADHIGRPDGIAHASSGTPLNRANGPRSAPAWAWSEDNYALGSNDFRSTKTRVVTADLVNGRGAGVRLLSDGSQAIRAWRDAGQVHLLVADYCNAGGEQFFHEHVEPSYRRLAINAEISGRVTLALLRGSAGRP